MIVDCHVHLLAPENRGGSYEDFAAEGPVLAEMMSNSSERQLWARANVEDLLATMDRTGVDRALVCGFPWRSPDRCRADNEYVRDAVAASGGKLLGLAVFQPLSPDGGSSEVRRWLGSPEFVGVKIKAGWQGYQLDDAAVLGPSLSVVSEQGGIALVHVEQSTKPANGNGPEAFLRMLEAFPGVRIIGAHFGAMSGMYHPYPPVGRRMVNVMFDTALGTAGEVAAAYLAVGLGRKMVFGSDYPYMDPDRILSALRTLPAPIREAIQSDNIGAWLPDFTS